VEIKPQGKWFAVSAAKHMSCAIDEHHALWCWGDNGEGALGDSTTVIKHRPVQISKDRDWQSVEIQEHYSCARKSNGSQWCWGKDVPRFTPIITAPPHSIF
jgi:alpha-tubulin suppressor-like RCC1 family protein